MDRATQPPATSGPPATNAPSAIGAAPPTCVVCAAQGAAIVGEAGAVTSNVRAFAHERFWFWRCAACLLC